MITVATLLYIRQQCHITIRPSKNNEDFIKRIVSSILYLKQNILILDFKHLSLLHQILFLNPRIFHDLLICPTLTTSSLYISSNAKYVQISIPNTLSLVIRILILLKYCIISKLDIHPNTITTITLKSNRAYIIIINLLLTYYLHYHILISIHYRLYIMLSQYTKLQSFLNYSLEHRYLIVHS